MSPLEPNSSDVYPLLKQRLRDGEFPAGQRLPSLRQLAQQYNLSVTHLHHIIRRLERENLVQVRHGSGVYAADPATRPQRILLLNPVEGDHWADFTRAFSLRAANDSHIRLLVESPTMFEKDHINRALAGKVRDMVREGVDVIVYNGQSDFGMGFLKEYVGKVPLVCFLIDQVLKGERCARVVSDWHHGGYAGMRHLIETGCRRIVVTQHDDPAPHPLADFLAGVRLAADESLNSVEVIPFMASVRDSIDDVLARFRKLYSQEQPDGVFAHADWAGSRILTDLRRRRLRVPQDVAVLGYLDTPWTMMTDPPMSSISTDPEAIVDQVRAIISTRQFDSQIVIKPRLVIRESTRAQPH